MIARDLREIGEAEISALIANAVAEGRTIEYKRDLPGNSDADKKEFLADASSFANTAGGDLIFGLEESQGVASQFRGVQSADLDQEMRRMDSILAAGLSPRIRYATKVVTAANGARAVVVRVERSWSGPHRVVFQGNDKFYGRNSAGKYPLDVNELRAAFTLATTVTERIRAFRTDRLIALGNNQTPLPFVNSPKIVLHCIPVESFAGQQNYNLVPFYENTVGLPPMGTTAWNNRLNLDGVLIFSTHQPCHSYTQLYRNGIIEVVQGRTLAHEYEGRLVIPSIAYERDILAYLPRCLGVLQEIGSEGPVVVALTLTKTRGLTMGVDSFYYDTGYPIDSDNIILPETVVEDLSTPANRILKPMFDLIWNACGFVGSPNFDADGNWTPRRR